MTDKLERLIDRHKRIADLQAEETDHENAELFDKLQMSYADQIAAERGRPL